MSEKFWNFSELYLRCVEIVPDLWPRKMYYLHDGIGTWTPIPFKIGLLRLHTLSPLIILWASGRLLLEWCSSLSSRSALSLLCSQNGILSMVFPIFKTTRCLKELCQEIGRLVNDWNSVSCQESLDQVWWMSWSIVMQLPVFCNQKSVLLSQTSSRSQQRTCW